MLAFSNSNFLRFLRMSVYQLYGFSLSRRRMLPKSLAHSLYVYVSQYFCKLIAPNRCETLISLKFSFWLLTISQFEHINETKTRRKITKASSPHKTKTINIETRTEPVLFFSPSNFFSIFFSQKFLVTFFFVTFARFSVFSFLALVFFFRNVS